jgi:anti-sigma-K factor RskA
MDQAGVGAIEKVSRTMTKQDAFSETVDLAGEYVLGTLQGKAREDFAQRLAQDGVLQKEVAAWERRLAPLLETVEPVTPPSSLWRQIEQRIQPRQQPGQTGLWNNLNFWRGLGMVMTTLVLGIALSLFGLRQETAELRSVMVVLNDQSQTGWLVGTGTDQRFLRVSAVQPTPLPSDKVCQLWMETADGELLPLGVLPHTGNMRMQLPTSLRRDNRFKVSIESARSAPVERPSEEIVFEGKLTRL